MAETRERYPLGSSSESDTETGEKGQAREGEERHRRRDPPRRHKRGGPQRGDGRGAKLRGQTAQDQHGRRQ